MNTLRAMKNKLSERINRLSREDCQLMLYCLCFLVMWQLDRFHCELQAKYYGCSVSQLLSYDRSWWLMLLSMVFGITDLFLAYKVLKLVRKVRVNVDITVSNTALLPSIKITGLRKVLQPLAIYVMVIAGTSILYDLKTIFVHILNGVR